MKKSQNLACPFCGKQARVISKGYRDGGKWTDWVSVTCPATEGGCGASQAAPTESEAWNNWNRRAGGLQPSAPATAEAKAVEHHRIVRRLSLAVMKEAVQKGWADIWDPSWNHKAHVELTLTIAEVRLAASLVGYHPTKAEISRGDELEKWDALIAEQDNAERAS